MWTFLNILQILPLCSVFCDVLFLLPIFSFILMYVFCIHDGIINR